MRIIFHKPLAVFFSIIFITVLGSNAPGAHTQDLGLLVGRIFTVSNDTQDYLSTSFIFSHHSSRYVITALHSVKNIKNKIFLQLSQDEIISIKHVADVPSEDTAIFELEKPLPSYVQDTKYEVPFSMEINEDIKIVGFTGDDLQGHDTVILTTNILTIASFNLKTKNITLPPHLNKNESAVILANCDVPFPGMSGGPVLNAKTNELIGMTKSFGIIAKDHALSDKIGAKEFHVIVRLDKTIEKIRNLP